eukprot:CAMPEP_0172452874 /NCGR_PEP_ID=MMETSP1065-20121228/10408_1 /TAXON_ID=265537 /ORGANISM="Amphiprora paludosa, Strain CCMP125" /LENGTH=301 /DNA_ID=CAMNT_0013205003 /DNA_START=23 /DNA_END=928 /DNA_ORIENTATION=+
MAGSFVGKIRSSFSLCSNDEQVQLHVSGSFSSLAVSSATPMSKSPSEVSYASTSEEQENRESETNSTASSQISAVSQDDGGRFQRNHGVDTSNSEVNGTASTSSHSDPPSMVVVHPEIKPYAQLCFNQELGTMTALLVGPRGPSLPFTGPPENDKEGISQSASVPDLSSSSSDESGWSTGDEMSSASSHVGSEELIEGILWMDHHWFQSTSDVNSSAYVREQHQPLLLPEPPVRFPTLTTTPVLTPPKRSAGCLWCPCYCGATMKSSAKNSPILVDPPKERKSYPMAHLPANWFRYMTLSD